MILGLEPTIYHTEYLQKHIVDMFFCYIMMNVSNVLEKEKKMFRFTFDLWKWIWWYMYFESTIIGCVTTFIYYTLTNLK